MAEILHVKAKFDAVLCCGPVLVWCGDINFHNWESKWCLNINLNFEWATSESRSGLVPIQSYSEGSVVHVISKRQIQTVLS